MRSLKRLGRLEGNVEMRNAPRDLFLSQRLFWDQRRHEIYSDTFVHIENADHVLEGTGFVSNEQLTVYRVLRPQGIFPVDRDAMGPSSPDSVAPSASPPSSRRAPMSSMAPLRGNDSLP